jgi:hypothetical protein
MKVDFLGICMFDPAQTPIQAFLPNVRDGLPEEHPQAKPHHALIAVPPESVDHSDWGDPVVRNIVALGDATFWTFDLDGVNVTFDPPPGGNPSTVNLSALPRTRDAVFGSCMDKTELLDNIDSVLSARVSIPGGPLQVVPVHVPGAPAGDDVMYYTELTVDDDVTIKATNENGTKILRMVNPATTIYIANIDLVPVDMADMADRALYCVMLQKPPQVAEAAARSAKNRVSAYRKQPTKGVAAASSSTKTKKDRGVRLSVITLGPGCSNTQWP